MSDLSKLKSSDPAQELTPTSIDFLPHDVIQAIRDPGDWQRRTNALETLKGILEEVSDISALLSNFGSFLSFLVSLLDDSHFRVIHTTLQIIEMLAERFGEKIETDILESTDTILHRITENRNSLYAREKMPKFFLKLMHLLSPHALMMRLVTSSLHSRSHKIREDTLIIIMAGLLTFPRTEFDLGSVAEHVVPLIADSRQRVRYTALEAISVIAHALEPGLLQETRSNYMQPLLGPVQRWETDNVSRGVLLKVIQARLSRKKLPHINSDGTVEPAVPFPTNASRQDSGMDIEWIISSTIERTQGEESEVSTNGSKLLPVQPPRRFSAGRQKLPWERERKEQSLSAPTKKEDGSYQMNFLHKQHGRTTKAPPPTYSNWVADADTTGTKNLSRSDRFYPNTMDSTDSSPKQPRASYMDQYLGTKRMHTDTDRDEFGNSVRESEFQNEDTGEADFSQSWPAQLFENSHPLPNTDSGHSNVNNTLASQFPFKLAKARPCSKQQPSSKPDRRPADSGLHLPAIERDPSEKPADAALISSDPERPTRPAIKRDRRAVSSKPSRAEAPAPNELHKVASSCTIGPASKEATHKDVLYSVDSGNAGRNNPVLPNRINRGLGADKPAVKMKPRSNTLPIPSTVAVDRKVKQEERSEPERDMKSQAETGTVEQLVPSETPNETWTNDLTATDPSSEQPRGNQVPNPSDEEPKLILKPPKAKPVRVSSKTRLRRTFIGPISLSDRADFDTSFAYSLAVDTSTSSLQDSASDLSHPRQKSHSLPRLPSDLASVSPEPQEVADRCEDSQLTPTPGNPVTQYTAAVSSKPSPEVEDNISEEIHCGNLANSSELEDSLSDKSNKKNTTENRANPSEYSHSPKQYNPSIKPPIPVRAQQKESSSYCGLYQKKKVFETESPSAQSSLSKKIEVDSILPNKIECKNRQYENVPLPNNGPSASRPVRRRVDFTRSLNHSVDDELEDSLFNDTSESVFSLSPSFGRYRASAESGTMDTSALSHLSLSPQELKKNLSPLKGEIDAFKPTSNNYKHNNVISSVVNSPYEVSGMSPMDCSPIDKLLRSPSYSPSHPSGEAPRIYSKGFSPSKGMKLAAKKPSPQPKAVPPNDTSVQKGSINAFGMTTSSIHSTPKHSVLPASPARAKHPLPLRDAKPSLDSAQLEEASLEPLSHPGAALADAFCHLEDEAWECKIEGLVLIKRLARHHTDTILPQVKQVANAVMTEVKNLRSSVSKAAISAFNELFVRLNRTLEPYLEMAIKTLLHKAGESNMFIREDVEKSLHIMMQHTNPSKAFAALISGGIGHKNLVVRKLSMQLLCYGMEQMGDAQVLTLPRDVLERLMLAITSTSQDNTPDARFYARKAITLVFENPEFDKRISKNLSPELVIKVQDLVRLVQTKGVGELPSAGLQSARQSRVGQQPPTRQNQQSADNRVESTGSVKNSYALRPGMKGVSGNLQAKPRKNSQIISQDSQTVSILSEDVLTRLESKKWDERLDAIREFHELITQHSGNISHDQRIVKAIDGYILRLTDSNSKVNVMAIEYFIDVISVLGNKLVQHLHPIFKALTSNLASKNQTMKVKAKESLETIITSIDHTYLVQPLSSVAQYANNSVRPVLLNSLADVSDALFEKKPGVVQKHVLPLIFSLLEHHLNAECLAALQNLCQVVYQHMNKSLFEKASRLSNSQQEKLRKLAS